MFPYDVVLFLMALSITGGFLCGVREGRRQARAQSFQAQQRQGSLRHELNRREGRG